MPSVDIVDLRRKKVGAMDLAPEVFGAAPNLSLVHEVVVMQRASVRQGSASTRTRGEVRGGGKKPWKQKHTGRARAGSIRSPLWRHGGTVFGPRPRRYGFAFPKAKSRAALQSALSAKLTEGGLVVVSDLALENLKTQAVAKALTQLGLTTRTLIVIGEGRADWGRAARNLRHVKVVRAEDLNVYDVLRHDAILIPKGEVPHLQEVWA